MDTAIRVDLHNEFKIVVEDIETGESREYKAQNIILNAMYTRLVNMQAYFAYIHFGTGTGTFDDPTRTSLYAHLGTKSATEEFKSAAYPTSQWRKKIVLNPEEYVGSTISEIGIAYGSNASNLVTHAAPKDSEGNPIAIGPKKATEVVTIYADIFITLYSPDYGMYFYDNGLRNYLLGATMASDQVGIAISSGEGNEIVQHADNHALFVKPSTRTPDAANKKVTSYVRIQADEYNNDVRFIDWRNMGIRVELPRPGVWSPLARTGINLGVGDGTKTKFPIPNYMYSNITAYIDGVKATGWSLYDKGIEFTTPPAEGLAVTADYTCPFIPKDADHVLDVAFTLQYGASEPPAVVSPPDYSGLPGVAMPVAGTATLGFFGEVTTANLISGEDLCAAIGLTAGTPQHSDEPWLKFARNGKVLYVAKKTYRHSISWNDINAVGAVFGEAVVRIGNTSYVVRLLSSEEWNALIYPVHVDYGQWAQYTDADLLVHYNYGNGSNSWTLTISGSLRVLRGHSSVSDSYTYSPSNSAAYCGFRPCLVPILLPATL